MTNLGLNLGPGHESWEACWALVPVCPTSQQAREMEERLQCALPLLGGILGLFFSFFFSLTLWFCSVTGKHMHPLAIKEECTMEDLQ